MVNLNKTRGAYTLVEILIGIAILSMLIALLLPAVQNAREASRRVACQNNLRQIALGILHHEERIEYFPTGGWSYAWVGDPERGFGAAQPGGWVYNILPFVGEANLRTAGRGQTGVVKQDTLAQANATSLPLFGCPSRSNGQPSEYAADRPPFNVDLSGPVAKSDYAINAGDTNFFLGPGPKTLAQGDSPDYPWPSARDATGISYQRSAVPASAVLDGLSKTYLVGEKNVDWSDIDLGNDQSIFSGHDYDLYRWTFREAPPMVDRNGSFPFSFGSPHPAGFFMAFCDGSVHLIRYDIEPEVHRMQGNREDGLR